MALLAVAPGVTMGCFPPRIGELDAPHGSLPDASVLQSETMSPAEHVISSPDRDAAAERAPSASRRRTWPILALSFGALMLVICLSGLALRQHAEQIRRQIATAQKAYLDRDDVLDNLRSQTLSLAIELRDYLLAAGPEAIAEERQHLQDRRAALLRSLAEVNRLEVGDLAARQMLRQQINAYLDSVDTALGWTAQERQNRRGQFLQKRFPSRQAVLEEAANIDSINLATLQQRQDNLNQALDNIEVFSAQVIALMLLLGVLIAALTLVRTARLENRADRHSREMERVSNELRQLSQQLVRVQEEERRSISRELHDEVGQMLTALRMELGNAEGLLESSSGRARTHLEAAVTLAEQTMRSVRGMARGLRPSMLDELGLGPALHWQAREFSRHTSLPVNLKVDDSLDYLPDNYRTCIYRVVQEALTNCAKHAQANNIQLSLRRSSGGLCLIIQDNGVGFDAERYEGQGIGLVGIKERVRELGGELFIFSGPQRGTLLRVEVPLAADEAKAGVR
jgi:signal transduction histidine kinase